MTTSSTHWTLSLPDGDFDAFIFDCDGTLADTMPNHYIAWCRALGEHSVHLTPSLFYDLGGVPTAYVVELLNERHQLTLEVDAVVHQKEQFFLEINQSVQPIEPVVSLARLWHGKKPMAVASGGHRPIVLTTLNTLGITPLFHAIVTAEDTPRGKPAPDPFLEAARRMGVEPTRCLVFEDTVTGLTAAKAAGMQCVLVPSAPERGVSV